MTDTESFFTTNYGGGMRISVAGRAETGASESLPDLMVNSSSEAVELFAHSKRGWGHGSTSGCSTR